MKRKWKVMAFDGGEYSDIYSLLEDVAEVEFLPLDEGLVARRIHEFDAYVASLYIRLDKSKIERAKNLRVIATSSTGTDHLDLVAAKERGIAVLTLKEDTEFLGQITATAEMAWALLLAVLRKLPWSFEAAKRGEWARDRFRGHQISGMTLGILGYGRLGRIMAQYGKGFRMRVLANDIRKIEPEAGVTMVDFASLLRESDVLSIHIHLTEENKKLINAPVFAQMKKGIIIINTSRGAIIDEAALVKALNSGQVGGAGLDVIEGEWNTDLKSHPLIRYANEHENLVISPHTGGVTCESQRMAIRHTLEKLKRHLESLAS